jgi:REP element-mobilizing transposase RayT
MGPLISAGHFRRLTAMSAADISAADGFPYPRRYSSLDLLGFDYSNTLDLHFGTITCNSSRPLFADLKLAKKVLSVLLLNEYSCARMRIHVYTLLPDRLHLLAGVKQHGREFSRSVRAFKSYAAQLYWRRSREIVRGNPVKFPARSVEDISDKQSRRMLAKALVEWRATLRPESVVIAEWPHVVRQHFLGNKLWAQNLTQHAVITTDSDLREKVQYIAMEPVRRGYVKRPEHYPFTGFNLCDEDMLEPVTRLDQSALNTDN